MLARELDSRRGGPAVIVAPGWMPAPAGRRRVATLCGAVATAASARLSVRAGTDRARRSGRAIITADFMATATYIYCLVQSARKPSAARVPARPARRDAGSGDAAGRAAVGRPCGGAARSLRSGTSRGVAEGSRLGVADRAGARGGRRALRGAAWRDRHPDEAVHDVLERRTRASPRCAGAARTEARVRAARKAAKSGACGCCEASRRSHRRRPRSPRPARRSSRRGSRRATMRARRSAAAADRRRCRVHVTRRDRCGASPSYERSAGRRRRRCSTRRFSCRRGGARASSRRRRRLRKQVSETGAQMTLTGPWPPYNFVGSLEETT